MKVEGTETIKAPRAQVWDLLTDPTVLHRCVPGCEALTANEDGSYKLTLKAGIGTIKGVFTGTIRLAELRPPEHYKMIVDGKGSVGFVKGIGTLDLLEQGAETTVNYLGDVSVGGTIASVGQRMIHSSAKLMAGQFFGAVAAAAAARAQTEAATAPLARPQHGFFRTALRWLAGWIRRWGTNSRP